ncbi:heat repeat-containing protein : Putative Deoxyhypusine monooxygenase OS=Microcystis aeruginosa PCC 9806 GN=MICAE_1330005 PE=4 SV=1: HEAT: HEAT_2: HEAT_2: HEAT_2 [Gemmataceae bacterium]|nr:heat repeat-containing protein : Putative Deoxyhypusine monooxygenase OS=Microcystis aeruginosa PCC 9806 GN=MICAE_1330005 PE=4 SV=1: HEAT: HEAT_2: HEAT_2: HEAT_2 [Gemmataceae bacterium]VTT99725.1 heat repeat-containing protein : Putative Deoxyhypusine monooxygenase OS=Microcystis aeruginosa PCC 9806 GN=MICAE_1330005 PE=4 SV=1: HEAT: HEAT_2: HEAT_2: HEAT_2 [Gemmataceae bacterium]
MPTPEEAGFWAALAADTPDDTARLAFADWLDERDDPRAAWLRDPDLAQYMRPDAPDPIPGLLDALRSEFYETRDHAVPLFARVGPRALAPLLDLCRGDDRTEEMVHACQALAEFDAELLAPHLHEFIRLIPIETAYVCNVIAKIGPAAAPSVQPLLDAEDRIGNRPMAQALAAIGPAAEPAVPRLVQMMCWDDYGSDDAATALVAIGPHTLEAALEGLNHVDHDVHHCGARRLERYGEGAIPRLTEVLDEPPSQRRTGAVLALAALAPAIAVPHLIDGLRTETSSHIRGSYLERIRAVGPAAVGAAPLLREMLRADDDGSEYGDAVAEALAAVTGDAGIPDLLKQLDDQDPTFRRRTLRVLATFAGSHPDARAALLRGLTDPDPEVRREALEQLGRVVRRGDEDVVEPLRPCLSDPDAEVRAGAAYILGGLKSSAAPAVPELIVAMRDPEENVRVAATATIDGMQHEEPRMLGALLAALDDPSEAVRRHAAHGLQEWGHMYPEYTAAVFARVNDPDPEIARGATRLIGKATEPTPELVAYLRNSLTGTGDVELRISAAAGLAKLSISDPDVLSAAFALLDETGRDELIEPLVNFGTPAMLGLGERMLARPDLRAAILRALYWDRSDADKLPVLAGTLAALADEESSVRAEAINVIAKMGPAASSALPRVRAALGDSDQFVRSAAVGALAKISPTPTDVLADIVAVLSDEESYPRKGAIQAIAALDLDPATKLPHVLTALADTDGDVLQEAAQAAGALGTSGAEAVPLLLPLLSHEEKWVRSHAADALGEIGGSAEAVAALRKLLADPEEWVRQRAAGALGKIGALAEDAVPDLAKLAADDPDDDVRRAAVEALAALGATEVAAASVDDLVRMLWSSDGTERASAAQSLGALGAAARAAVPELARALRDPAWGDVRKETLKRFTVMGMIMIPMEQIEAIGAMDQRIHVTTALRQIGPPEDVIPLLAKAMGDANALVAASASSELEELLPGSEPALRELLTHPDANVRSWAESALAPKDSAE